MNIDIRTVVLISVITCITCTLFIIQLWRQNRGRFNGIGFLVIDFSLQTSAFTLIVLRGAIPDFLSIILANIFAMSGAISGYIGLLKFLDKKNTQVYNYLLLAVFTAVHIYFTYWKNSLEYRDLNVSVALLIICFQCSILLLNRVTENMKPLTFWPGIIFAGYCILSLARIIKFFVHANYDNDFFHSGLLQAIVQIFFITLFLLLTYSIVIMVNKRLLIEIEVQEEKFSKAFHSAPYAITLSRMEDGTIFDINDGFTSITGYERSEVIGKNTPDLHLFSDDNDRSKVVEELTKTGKVSGMDIPFRKKNGEPVTGHLSAEMISIDGEQCIIANIADITERKTAEDRIKTLLAEKELILKEVHHRIKNNMYMIQSLLNLQADRMTREGTSSALEDAASRVQSMMLLYEKLYQSDNISEVPADKYLPELISQILTNFPIKRPIELITRIDDFSLDAKTLSSLGIIINELLTNSMKYAFTGRDNGIITVSASKNKHKINLIIQDNGCGVPESINFENSSGFGFSLVKMLTAQLKGTIALERINGSRFVIEFDV